MKKFMVLSTQRSGSSFLGRTLNSHSRISCYGEVFLRHLDRPISYRNYRTATLARRVQDAFRRQHSVNDYLAKLIRSEPNVDAFGFKFMYGQARRYPEVLGWCAEHEASIVHLIRRNSLRVMVSRLVAKKRGVYLSTQPLAPITVRINLRTLIRELEGMQALHRHYRSQLENHRYIELTYEDLMSNYKPELERLLAFLGIDDDEELDCDLVKTGGGAISDVVENYREVQRVLRAAGYGELLDD